MQPLLTRQLTAIYKQNMHVNVQAIKIKLKSSCIFMILDKSIRNSMCILTCKNSKRRHNWRQCTYVFRLQALNWNSQRQRHAIPVKKLHKDDIKVGYSAHWYNCLNHCNSFLLQLHHFLIHYLLTSFHYCHIQNHSTNS